MVPTFTGIQPAACVSSPREAEAWQLYWGYCYKTLKRNCANSLSNFIMSPLLEQKEQQVVKTRDTLILESSKGFTDFRCFHRIFFGKTLPASQAQNLRMSIQCFQRWMEARRSMALFRFRVETEAHNYTYIILDLFVSACSMLYCWEWELFAEEARTVSLSVLKLLEWCLLHQGILA